MWTYYSTMFQVKYSSQSEVGVKVGDVGCYIVVCLSTFYQPYLRGFYLRIFTLVTVSIKVLGYNIIDKDFTAPHAG